MSRHARLKYPMREYATYRLMQLRFCSQNKPYGRAWSLILPYYTVPHPTYRHRREDRVCINKRFNRIPTKGGWFTILGRAD